jgi:Arc/MetJ-type ribon-helix-helix transcriptional regulator
MDRKTVSVNFDKDVSLYKYVKSQKNSSDFIRDCIREKMEREKGHTNELEHMVERVVKKCLKQHSIRDNNTECDSNETQALKAAASFFDD